MNIKECKHCGISFDLDSWAKKQAGGKINECPDCVEELGTETAVNGGYGGHLSSSNSTIGGRPMRHVGYNAGNANHKGKA